MTSGREGIGRLVDKSLVLVDRMLPTGQRYRAAGNRKAACADRLDESGAGDAVRERHLKLAFAKTAQANLFGRRCGSGWNASMPNCPICRGARCDSAQDGK
jgi:hypothetical protein